MTEPIKMSTEPIDLVPVTIIGTKQDAVPTTGTVAVTPKDAQPNLIVRVVQPAVAILIRFVNAFLVQFSGLFLAALTPVGSKLLYATDMPAMVLTCASLALPGALAGLAKDLVTVFGKLEGKYPLLTGSI